MLNMMRVTILTIVLFSVFIDFSAPLFNGNELLSNCDDVVQCYDLDYHADTDSSSHDDQEKHCHCHSGHSHIAVVYTCEDSSELNLNQKQAKYPNLLNGKPQNYHSDVIRPPIV